MRALGLVTRRQVSMGIAIVHLITVTTAWTDVDEQLPISVCEQWHQQRLAPLDEQLNRMGVRSPDPKPGSGAFDRGAWEVRAVGRNIGCSRSQHVREATARPGPVVSPSNCRDRPARASTNAGGRKNMTEVGQPGAESDGCDAAADLASSHCDRT